MNAGIKDVNKLISLMATDTFMHQRTQEKTQKKKEVQMPQAFRKLKRHFFSFSCITTHLPNAGFSVIRVQLQSDQQLQISVAFLHHLLS